MVTGSPGPAIFPGYDINLTLGEVFPNKSPEPCSHPSWYLAEGELIRSPTAYSRMGVVLVGVWETDAFLHHYWGAVPTQLSLGAHSQPRGQGIGSCPGAALWLGPEEESHTRMNLFASIYLQNLNLGRWAGPCGEGDGLVPIAGFTDEGRRQRQPGRCFQGFPAPLVADPLFLTCPPSAHTAVL